MEDICQTPVQKISSVWPEIGSSTFDFEDAKITIFREKNFQDSDKQLHFKITSDSKPKQTFYLKITSVVINKDSSKNVEKINIVKFKKNQIIADFSFDFPTDQIDEEHGWIINGEFNVNTSFCLDDSQHNNDDDSISSNSLDNYSDNDTDNDNDDDESFETIWLINNYLKTGTFKSDTYNIGSNKIHFEAIRTKSNIAKSTPFSIDILVDEITEKYNIKVSVTLMNQDQEKNRKAEKNAELSQNTDRVVITFPDLMQSEITSQNGFIKNNQVMVVVQLSSNDEENDGTRVKLSSNNYLNNITYNYNYNDNYNYSYTDSSKEKTGYVGLLNQGATCYMNSMLQSLYHTPVFRKFIYEIPTIVDENESTNVILNLQRLFGMMQLSDKACSTKSLTKSFGWDSHRTFIQHDTQEFLRVLIDNIDEKIKNNDKLKDGIAKILRGQTRNYVRCKNVDFESSRTEYFLDLSMTVKGCPTLQDSFKKYVEKEDLTGDNQYDTGNPSFGKQDASMGSEFLSFPPVLHLHLRRFEYDFDYDRNIKINDRFEFPKEIDLDPYLAKDGDRTKSNIYDLYGVLVHSGSVSYGHYYAFLRTSTDPQWFEFNDTTVSKVDEKKAIEENFGGQQVRSFSAYLLVYVRREDAPKIFETLPEDIIPQHIRDYIENPEKVVKSVSSTAPKIEKKSESLDTLKSAENQVEIGKNEKKDKSEGQKIDDTDVNGIKLKTLPHLQMDVDKEKITSKEVPLILFDYDDENIPLSIIKADTNTTLTDLINFIAKSRRLNYDPQKDSLFLFSKDYFYDRPATTPISLKIHSTLLTVVNTYKNDSLYFIYYRFIQGITESDLENKLLLSIKLSIDGCSYVKKDVILVSKTAKGYEILDAAFEKIDLSEFKIDKNSLLSDDKEVKYKNVRLMPIKNSKIVKISSLKSAISAYYTEYRIDIIPEDQRNLNDNEIVVQLSPAAVQTNNQPLVNGIPFFMKLKKDETIEQLKLILKEKLDINEKEFPKLKLFQGGEYAQIVPKNELKNDKVLGKLDLKGGIFVVKSMHRVGNSFSRKKEEALKIDN